MKRKRLISKIILITILFLFVSALAGEAQAQKEKIGWVGPIYKELSDSLMKGV